MTDIIQRLRVGADLYESAGPAAQVQVPAYTDVAVANAILLVGKGSLSSYTRRLKRKDRGAAELEYLKASEAGYRLVRHLLGTTKCRHQYSVSHADRQVNVEAILERGLHYDEVELRAVAMHGRVWSTLIALASLADPETPLAQFLGDQVLGLKITACMTGIRMGLAEEEVFDLASFC